MKKNSILIAAFILGASLGRAQTPSGQTASPSGQTAGPSGFSTTSPQQQQPGVVPPTTTGPNGAVLPIDATRNRVLIDTQNRPGFGGTNQTTFGTTNRPFGTTNQIVFGNTNGVPFATNAGPSPIATTTNGSVIFDQSGAARQNAVTGLATADQAFAQRLQAALARSGATQVFFPQTRSTIQVLNQNGTVTLQGVVMSEAEKQSIEAKVRAMQGVTAINNQLQVSANQLPQSAVPAPAPGSDRRLLTP
jgi:hypothetical protein